MAMFVVAGTLAVVATIVLVLWNADSSDESEAFISTPQFALWLLLLSGQAAIWVGAAPFVAVTIRRRYVDLRSRGALSAGSVLAIVAAVVTLLLLVLFLIGAPQLGPYDAVASAQVPNHEEWPLSYHQPKMLVFVGTGAIIGLAAVAGMWLTTAGFHDLARHARPRAASVERFLALRSEMTALLAVAGTLIGLATLSSGALREAVLADDVQAIHRQAAVACLTPHLAAEGLGHDEVRRQVRTDLDELVKAYPQCSQLAFDARYVIAYGLLFTGILALAFAPTLLAMRQAGERLRDRSFPLPRPNSPTFEATVERRASFDTLLETNLAATATFKAGVAIVTPLAASLVSAALPM